MSSRKRPRQSSQKVPPSTRKERRLERDNSKLVKQIAKQNKELDTQEQLVNALETELLKHARDVIEVSSGEDDDDDDNNLGEDAVAEEPSLGTPLPPLGSDTNARPSKLGNIEIPWDVALPAPTDEYNPLGWQRCAGGCIISNGSTIFNHSSVVVRNDGGSDILEQQFTEQDQVSWRALALSAPFQAAGVSVFSLTPGRIACGHFKCSISLRSHLHPNVEDILVIAELKQVVNFSVDASNQTLSFQTELSGNVTSLGVHQGDRLLIDLCSKAYCGGYGSTNYFPTIIEIKTQRGNQTGLQLVNLSTTSTSSSSSNSSSSSSSGGGGGSSGGSSSSSSGSNSNENFEEAEATADAIQFAIQANADEEEQ